MKLNITCKQATDFISRKEERKLRLWQRVQLMYHLLICSFCKLFYRQNKIITGQAARIQQYPDASLSEAQKEGIATALSNDSAQAG